MNQVVQEPQIAMIAMQSNGENIDVQMGLSHGELDMETPHGYMLNWMAQNWEMIQKMCQVSYTAYREQDNQSQAPTPMLVGVEGQSLQHEGA